MACDSFKGTLSSKEVGSIICEVLNKKNYNATSIIVSDGGEGMLEAIAQNKPNLKKVEMKALDALRREIKTYYLYDEISKTAYIELANVVGIKDLHEYELDPYHANTFGFGMQIKDAIKTMKAKKIILSLGGSASNDGGCGMLEALGVKFYKDEELVTNLNNQFLSLVTNIDVSELNELIKDVSFITLTDVTNPLLGNNGAVYTFGPQKGAKQSDLPILENNIKHFVELSSFIKDFVEYPGYGAAGGVGFATHFFLNSTIQSGIKTLLDDLDFASMISKYDILITGEGCYDDQSLNGKVVSGILEYQHKCVKVVCGITKIEKDFVYSIVPKVATKEESLKDPKGCLKKLIEISF